METAEGVYDYIITGTGCAGFSLLCRMMANSFFDEKKILLLDQSFKNSNDKTWCFWERQPGFFEPIVHHSWQEFDFFSNKFSGHFAFFPYQYKMIRSIDLYNYALNIAKQKKNLHFQNGKIESIGNEKNNAFAIIDGKKFTSRFLFNSIVFDKKFSGRFNLLQHFKGWLIETEAEIFDTSNVTFMDFRAQQVNGAAFFYVLPVSANKALVEYTLFSTKLLNVDEYDSELKKYIQHTLNIERYTITEQEFGVIPMTDHHFSKGAERIVNIGTAGGYTKASSGFTFQFIQKHCENIVEALINDKDVHQSNSFFEKRFKLYDRVLLHLLYHKKLEASEIFERLFKKNSIERVLKFLDNETTFADELKIMQSMPSKKFLPVALQELFHI